MKTVYVVAWEYNTGGGFDWYFTPDAAQRAFDKEKTTADELRAENWRVYLFSFTTNAPTNEEITDEINWSFCCDGVPAYATIYPPEAAHV